MILINGVYIENGDFEISNFMKKEVIEMVKKFWWQKRSSNFSNSYFITVDEKELRIVEFIGQLRIKISDREFKNIKTLPEDLQKKIIKKVAAEKNRRLRAEGVLK